MIDKYTKSKSRNQVNIPLFKNGKRNKHNTPQTIKKASPKNSLDEALILANFCFYLFLSILSYEYRCLITLCIFLIRSIISCLSGLCFSTSPHCHTAFL